MGFKPMGAFVITGLLLCSKMAPTATFYLIIRKMVCALIDVKFSK